MKYTRLSAILLVLGLLIPVILGACSPASNETVTITSTKVTTSTINNPNATVTSTVVVTSSGTSAPGSGTDIAAAAAKYLSSVKSPNIAAKELYDLLAAGETPYIIDTRSHDLYIAGHIPGAYNIGWKDVFKDVNLMFIPKDKQVIVYSDIGDISSQVTALLNVMGFNAVNLKWGMTSWTTNPDLIPDVYDVSKDCIDVLSIPGDKAGAFADLAECG
jgi:rhodanese-related sulfurtransferase